MVAERQARVRSTRSWPRMAFFLLLRGAGCISLENGGISSMAKSALEDFRCFAGIAESWELIKTGLVVIAGTSYKLELWHSYSNPDIPYYVSTYVQEQGVWRKLPDQSFPIAPVEKRRCAQRWPFWWKRVIDD